MIEKEPQFTEKVGPPEAVPSREALEDVKSIRLFVVRHGRSEYLERESVKKLGKWAPETKDITPEGEAELLKTAERLAGDIDPERDIVVFFSSPRARALRSKEVLEKYFRERGIEIYEGSSPIIEMLRSGGDYSPVTGEGGRVEYRDRSHPRYDVEAEGEEKTEGIRFQNFLSFFNAIARDRLVKLLKEPTNKFHGKVPVFVGIIHGEVVHAGSSQKDYFASFLGRAFPEHERVRLRRGQAMKIEFDLTRPGDLSLTIPPEMSPMHKAETKQMRFDYKSGAVGPLPE